MLLSCLFLAIDINAEEVMGRKCCKLHCGSQQQ